MPVVRWDPLDSPAVGPRQMHAPKESSLKGWWNAARRAIPKLPRWVDVPEVKGYADEKTIHYQWWGGDLFISRKRNMR